MVFVSSGPSTEGIASKGSADPTGFEAQQSNLFAPISTEPEASSAAWATSLQNVRQQWRSSSRAPLITGACITAAALLAASYFIIFARSSNQAPETTVTKTDLPPFKQQSIAQTKGSLPVAQGSSPSKQAEAPDSQSIGEQDQQMAPPSGQRTTNPAKLFDVKNWVAVTRTSDFQTYFFKEVTGKGSSDARVSMLINFATAQSLHDGSASYRSLMYLMSIDCGSSTGGPVEMVWNTGQFLSGENLNNPMPSLNQKRFAENDPMLLFACN